MRIVYDSSVRELIVDTSNAIINILIITTKVKMSEDGSIIFNCICISSAYEWYVIWRYLSKIKKSGWMYILNSSGPRTERM